MVAIQWEKHQPPLKNIRSVLVYVTDYEDAFEDAQLFQKAFPRLYLKMTTCRIRHFNQALQDSQA